MSQPNPDVVSGRSFIRESIDDLIRGEQDLTTALLDTAPCLIVILDRAGRIIHFNRVCREVTGYAFEEARNRRVWDFLLPPEQTESVKAVFENLIQEGPGVADLSLYPHTYENEWITKAGEPRLILWSNKSLRGDDGRIVAVMGTGLDVTERRKAEDALRASEKRYRLLVDHASVCIKELDRDGRIISMNPAGVRMLGAGSEAEVVGRRFVDCVSTAERTRINGLLNRAFGGELSEFEFAAFCRQKDLTLTSTLIPIRGLDGSVEKVMGITQDVTERNRTRARLVEQESLAQLGEMAAIVAHEVRNPLAGIRGSLEVIGPRLPAGSRAKTEVESLVHRVDGLNEMLEDLLSFSRPQSPTLVPIALETLLRDAVEVLKQDGPVMDVTVEMSGDMPLVRGDGEQLTRVFLNLLLNGVQAMDAPGQIRVRSRVSSGRCEVDFCDQGRGIPPELGDKVFEPFVTTKHRGTGLGLAIAKRTLEAHGGSIRLLATGDTGTTVRIALPLDRTAPSTA
jgi:PAS domain S-box-containing protein